MTRCRRFLRWYGLLTKRLFRHGAYLATLLLMALLALGLSLFARQGGAAVRVALALSDPQDKTAAAVVRRLLDQDSLLRVTLAETPEEAREAVVKGSADAAWIFSADTEAAFSQFARLGRGLAVTVVQREEQVLLTLARERLFVALYPELSRAMFADYLAGQTGVEALAPEELAPYYAIDRISETMLRFETAEGEAVRESALLTAPLRGLFYVLLVYAAMAAGLLSYREEREGVFFALSARGRRFLPLLSALTAVVPAALVALVSLYACGLGLSLAKELFMLLWLVPAAALFTELLRCLCPGPESYGALGAVLSLAMLLLCPVFVDLRLLQPLRMLLPPYWALRAAAGAAHPAALPGYLAALLALTVLAVRLRQKRRGL